MAADNKYTFQILGSDKTKAAFASLNASVRKTVNVAGAMGAGVAAGLAVMVTKSIEANTEMARLAHSVGVGSQVLSEWSHAAGTVNLEGDKMADIFKDIQDKIGDLATTGGGGAADLFKRLNLDVKEFVSLAPDQQLLKVGTALDSVKSRSEKVFLLESLASDASQLLPLLEDNAEGLREMQEEAQSLGISVSEVDAAKMEAAKRSMERVNSAMTGLANKVSVELSPFVEVLAEGFVSAATEGDRLGKAIKKGFEVGAKVAGVFADGIHGVQIIAKGLEVVFRGFSTAAITGFGEIVSLLNDGVRNSIIDGVLWPITKVLELLSKVSPVAGEVLADVNKLAAKVKGSAAEGFQGIIDAQTQAFQESQAELLNLLASDLPSTVINTNIERIVREAEAKALAGVAELNQKLNQGIGGSPDSTSAEDEEAEKHRAKLAARLQRLDESHFTEIQKLAAKLAEENALIQQAADENLLTEEGAQARRLLAWEAFEKGKTDLAAKSEKTRQTLLQTGLKIAEAFTSTGSKKMFKLQKVLALAQAAVSLPPAIIDSFKNAGGYPMGIPPAAAMAATGAAQIASIKRQSIGGGGSVAGVTSGGGGGTPALSSPAASDIQTLSNQFGGQGQNQGAPATQLHLHIAGDVNGDTAELMLQKLRELIEGSDAVLFSPNSRQAQELVPG